MLIRNITMLILGLTLVPLTVRGQSVDVILKGVVRDQTGAVLPGVTVKASNTGTGLVQSTTSSDAGYYSLPPIPAGNYDVAAELAGFTTQLRRNQIFYVGTAITLDFILRVAPTAETIEVVAESPVLETTKNTLSRLVQKDEIDTLPVVNRNFNDLAALSPGVTRTPGALLGSLGVGVDISGSRDFQNAYNVDGVSSEAQSLGNQRIAYAQDWIQEFQVLTNQYAAEFGQASGGVLNAITRSGANQWNARAYGFFRNEAWDATPAFATSKAPLDEKRLGGTIGGALVKDRLFYFGGFERLKNESSNIVMSAFPSSNGTFPFADERTLFIAKADYQPNPSHTVRVRYNGQRQDTSGSAIGGIFSEEHGRFLDLTANDIVGTWTNVVSPTLFNEARAAFGTVDPRGGCNFAERNPPGTWFERFYPGGRFGCPVNFGRIAQEQVQLVDNLSWVRGTHEIKAGIRADSARFFGDFRNFRDGRYVFASDAPFSLANSASYPAAFTIVQGPTTWDLTGWSYGLFVQDSWRVSPALTLNLGLRYDLDGSLAALNPLVRVDQGLHTIDRDTDNVSPRAGVAWTPFDNDNRTVIRGGAGLYYDQNHNNVAGILLANTILVDRQLSINAFDPGSNPFWPDVARARQFLAEAFARNTVPDASLLPGVVSVANDVEQGIQVPSTMQTTAGIAHDFQRGLSVSADVVYSHGFDQYVIKDVNIDRTAALNENRIVRLNPNFIGIFTFGTEGEFDYKALQVQATYRPSARHLAKLSYTLAKNESNTFTILTGGGATNPFDLDEDKGPTDNDAGHVLSVNGSTILPLDIQLSAIASYQSALPYSAITAAGQQLDADPFPDRPEPRNARRGDSFFSLDARLAKIVKLGGRRSVTAFVEGFNLTNTTNFTSYVGTVTSNLFGMPTFAFPKRRMQLGFRVDF